jgi:diguanylate cyclase (GGDEF)-like protein
MMHRHQHVTRVDSLSQAQAMLKLGRGDEALSFAQAALDHARQSQDLPAQAEAMLCLAGIELRLFGRFMRALEWSRSAAQEFERAGQVRGECQALATHSVAAARVGHFGRAMENALLALRLARSEGLGHEQLLAYRAVGLAAFNGRNFDEARNAYELAIKLARACEPPINAFELHVGLASNAAAHYFSERCLGGDASLPQILDALERHVAECRRLLASHDGDISVTPGSHGNNLAMVAKADAHLRAWRKQLPEANAAVCELRTLTQDFRMPWLASSVKWAEAEVALAEGRLDQAQAFAVAIVDAAKAHRYEAQTSVGLQLVSHISRIQGDDSAALNALQQLLRRERAARAQSLKARTEVVDWQFELRQNRLSLARAQTDSRLFERLAMEDPLTGLPNRRHIETALAARLAVDALPMCVALLDVDRFKQVNDEHSHSVGDAVLRTIAGLLGNFLGKDDLAGRLGGDEFVLLLEGAGIDAAGQVCERIELAVREYAWQALSTGLEVSLSIGVVEACAGDTVAQLLQRSDDRMYAAKRLGRPAA